MNICKGCGGPLEWIETPTGRYIPVDPEPVFVIENEGKDRFITDEGESITGRYALPEEERRKPTVAFVPHLKTCPVADSFRRK